MAYTQMRIVDGKKVRVGTFMLVRQFKGIGRIRIASGTNDPKTFKLYETALQDLYNTGNAAALTALKNKKCTPRELYLWWRDKTTQAPWQTEDRDLYTEITNWLSSSTLADTTIVGYKKCVDLLRKYTKIQTARVSDLPSLLIQFKKICESKRPPKAKTFNQTRAAALSFVRKTTEDKTNPIYLAIKNIDIISENLWSKKRVNNPLLPAEVDAAFTKTPNDELRDIVWFLCLTGMTPKEYLSDGWEVDGTLNGVRVFGRKRSGRYARIVPRVYQKLAPLPQKSYRTLLEEFKKVFPGRALYDLRRSFAVWNNRAGIDQLHTKAYMGHGASMTEKYMAQNTASWLIEDAAKLATYIARDRTSAVTVLEERLTLPSTPDELTRNLQDERLDYFRELLNEQLKTWHTSGKMRRLYKVDRLVSIQQPPNASAAQSKRRGEKTRGGQRRHEEDRIT